jgi:hypothetical protein
MTLYSIVFRMDDVARLRADAARCWHSSCDRAWAVGNKGMGMHKHVLEISTEVFHVLEKKGPGYVSWSEAKPGPTQRILVGDDVYNEFIDRAIAKRKTLDEVVLEVCGRR